MDGRLDKLTFSPDGRQAIFEMGPGDGQQGQGQRVHRARFDLRTRTLSRPEPLGDGQDVPYLARFGPDGQTVYYLSRRTGRNQLYRYDLATRAETRLTADDGVSHEAYCLPGLPP